MQGLEEPTEVIGTQRADRSGGLRALIGQGGLVFQRSSRSLHMHAIPTSGWMSCRVRVMCVSCLAA